MVILVVFVPSGFANVLELLVLFSVSSTPSRLLTRTSVGSRNNSSVGVSIGATRISPSTPFSGDIPPHETTKKNNAVEIIEKDLLRQSFNRE